MAKVKDSQERKYIKIKGARVNNLKNVSLDIETDKLVVVTGLSGSGKSSLAFDTLYAEGQRRYVESLSSYARQFLGRINKPEVDSITGIAPAIAIEQKVSARNPRSTVGTTTEIYDYLKLLYARAGETFSPLSGVKVENSTVESVFAKIKELPQSGVLFITAKIKVQKEYLIDKIVELISDGYDRVVVGGVEKDIPTFMSEIDSYNKDFVNVIIGKFPLSTKSDNLDITDALEKAFEVGNQYLTIYHEVSKGKMESYDFSTNYEADGMIFEKPFDQMFSFNNPLGACPTCSGYGKVVGVDESLVVPDKSKSLFGDAVVAWRGEVSSSWKNQIIESVEKSGFPIHKPYGELSESDKKRLWKGDSYFKGIDDFFAMLDKERYKIQCRVMIARYTGKRTCPDCDGARLRKESLYIKIDGHTISDLTKIPIEKLDLLIDKFELSEYQKEIASRLLIEVKNRISYLMDVGLGYLTLDRLSATLSGGESQRINLASSLGSSLVGSMYILDEPSIGLHPRDTERLISVLKQLRDIGNTVIVVEHDEEIMRAADEIIDVGPRAGIEGGEIVFQGVAKDLKKAKNSLTADYLLGKKSISVPTSMRKWDTYIEVTGARENNLKNIDVKFPLRAFTCVTGVSGSGKSSLVKDVLHPALSRHYNEMAKNTFNYDELKGNLKNISRVEMINQNPIGKSSRSNPVTYIKAYDEIRKLYSSQPNAVAMSLTPSSFSFNIAGGRCEECQGEGVTHIEMQFMADVVMPCESCEGKRFKSEVLMVKYRDMSISDVLDMSVSDAIKFFDQDKSTTNKKIVNKLSVLNEVGLGYVKLGQSSSTLSGGESQRVKLASFLIKENATEPILFIFDEPTTGLHFHDINKLLKSLNSLVDNGHTVIVVEHNMDVVKCADWVIDLGQEGGDKGGNLVFAGTVSDMLETNLGYTVNFLRESLRKRK